MDKRPETLDDGAQRATDVGSSDACDAGLGNEVRNERAGRWQIENADGFQAWNVYVERNGVPLAKYRKF
jgi:antitoxin CcdA